MDSQKPRISIVAAIGKKREIGSDNKLLWHIPDDLKRFKALTLGHPVIMGRKTFESIVGILGKPLPGRTNIVVTRSGKFPKLNAERSEGEAEGVSRAAIIIANSIEDALEKAHALDTEEIFIGGGAQVWEQSLPFVDRLYLTLIDDEKEGDTFFPPYESQFKKIVFHEHRDHEGLKYCWVDLER